MSTKLATIVPLLGGASLGGGGVAALYSTKLITTNKKGETVINEGKPEDYYDLSTKNKKLFSDYERDIFTNPNPSFMSQTTRYNDGLGLKEGRCFSTWFPGNEFSKPENRNTFRPLPNMQKLNGRQPDTLKPKAPVHQEFGHEPRACSSMVLTTYKRYFLFNSEVSLRNDKVGLALWTGIKTSAANSTATEAAKEKTLTVKVGKFLMFLEKQGNDWKVKGGYYRMQKVTIPQGRKITIMSPDAMSIRESISKDSSWGDSVKNSTYSGLWTPQQFQIQKPLEFSEGSYPNAKHADLLFTATQMQGYDTTEGFLDVDNTKDPVQEYPWRQYVDPNKAGYNLELNVKDNVNSWFEPFRGQNGVWIKTKLNDLSFTTPSVA